MKNIVLLFFIMIGFSNVKAQSYSDYFVTYDPVYTPEPPRPVFVMPDIIDNSVTIIRNSYNSYSNTSIRCIKSQNQMGQVLLIDLTEGKPYLINVEANFKVYSNDTYSIMLKRGQFGNDWYSIERPVYEITDLLNDEKMDRNLVLDMLKMGNYFAIDKDFLFIF